ncbi:DNA helicase-2/ATP-dependent DNA helicase PcrA [Rhodanobacter sp. TND4EL1]
MTDAYSPTPEQEAIVAHEGPAFVTACPGAGKTRTMVERARQLMTDGDDRRGVAFLSFTNAAVDELESRLRSFDILPTPLFPSFIGTFDRFLWQFFVAPFGMEGCEVAPRLIPDKREWQIQPHPKMQPLPLRAFDRQTGKVNRQVAAELGYSADRDVARHEAHALKVLTAALTKGHVDFDDVRQCVRVRLGDKAFASRLGTALAARFREVVVDEAQDCNPEDLEIVQWLRDSGLTVKVICDPNQSIYQFRGGVTDELNKFGARFDARDRLPMSGNFRSTPAICSAIVALRPPASRASPDQALGRHKGDLTPVYILAYGGTAVPDAIGKRFNEITKSLKILSADAPVLASRLVTAAKAIGHPSLEETEHMTLVLARAVTDFYFSFGLGNRRETLVGLHRAVLLIQDKIGSLGEYHEYVATNALDDGRWRPEIIEIAAALRFADGMDAGGWLTIARDLLGPGFIGTGTIGQRLRSHAKLGAALASPPVDFHPARTIHSAKGMEFPAVCVVLTIKKAGDILAHLEGAGGAEAGEDARKIYVAASRAQRLLVMAIPKSKATRLSLLLTSFGSVTVINQI